MKSTRKDEIEKYTAAAKQIAELYKVKWDNIIANNRDPFIYNIRLIIFRWLQNRGAKYDMIAEIMKRKENTLTAWSYDLYFKTKDEKFKKLSKIIEKGFYIMIV